MNFFMIDIDLGLICAFDEALLEIRHSYSFCISIDVIALSHVLFSNINVALVLYLLYARRE